MTSEIVIHADNLTKQFGDFIATNAITFDVFKGEIFGFLGANGAGKTTAMRMLCGLSRPSSGKAMVAGFDVGTQADSVKRQIGYMSQKFSLYEDLTVRENIRFYGGVYGLSNVQIKEKTALILQKLTLTDFANAKVQSLPLGWMYEAAASGMTVFVTTHYMDEAEYCNRVSIMVDGKIAALDTPENLKKQFGAADMYEVFLRLARDAKRND
jgi:ABC-2 type transport system ATP-binding protein